MRWVSALGHQLHTYKVNKKLISPTDSRLWVSGPFDTLPFSHYRATADQSTDWTIPSACNISEELGGPTDCALEQYLLCLGGTTDRVLRCLFCRANTELFVPTPEDEER